MLQPLWTQHHLTLSRYPLTLRHSTRAKILLKTKLCSRSLCSTWCRASKDYLTNNLLLGEALKPQQINNRACFPSIWLPNLQWWHFNISKLSTNRASQTVKSKCTRNASWSSRRVKELISSSYKSCDSKLLQHKRELVLNSSSQCLLKVYSTQA